MRTSACFALLFAAATGCGTDSTVSGVFPAEGFTGRSLRVEISGDATEWSGTPGVNFGQGVTVSNVTVASPTTLFADITVDPGAALGTRDVTVTNDGTFTLKQAFKLESPIEVTFQGMAAQGGIPYFTITNHDFDTPFDLTQDAAGNNVNLQITGPTGVQFLVSAATAYQVSGYAAIDVDATPGPVSIVSGPMSKSVTSNLGANVDITARTPMPLSDSTTGMLADVGDSMLYSIDVASGPTLLRLNASSSAADAKPVAAVLPTGSWADATSGARMVVPSAATMDVVVFDNGTAGGYNYTLTKKAETITTAAEGNDTNNNNASGALVAGGLPFMQTGGTLSSATDTDNIKVTLAAAGRLHVFAGSSNGATDTAVDVKNGTTSVFPNSGGTTVQDDAFSCILGGFCSEDVVTPMLTAGTYSIEISAGGSYDTTAKDYSALIYIE